MDKLNGKSSSLSKFHSLFMPNLMKDNVVPETAFPLIVNWKFAFSFLYHMPIPYIVIVVKNGS